MEIYFVLFAVLLFFTLIELSGRKIGNIVKFLLAIMLVGLSGFRYEVGNDYNNYVRIFNSPDSFGVEPGYIMMNVLVSELGYKVQALFLICSVFTILLLAYTINKYCPKYFCTALSVYVLSYIYFEGMNTVRQALSMSILFFSFCNYINNHKIRYFIPLALLAVLFHFSSIVIAIIGWLMIHYSGKDIKVWTFAIIIAVSFLAGIFIQEFIQQLAVISSWVGYDNYMDKVEQRGVNSGAFHYALNLYAFAFLYFIHLKGKYFSEIEKASFKLFLSAVIIYNLFINFYIGLRFYWYFYLFIALVVPATISKIKKDYRIVSYFIIMFVFSLYTILSLGSVYYNPYKYTFDLIGR